MALAAAGGYSKFLERAKKTLGQCTTWQTWTGDTGDETNATLHIAEYEKLWTEVQVDAGRDVRAMLALENMHLIRGTSVWTGTLVIHFEMPVAGAYVNDPEQAFRDFNNNAAQVIAEMVSDATADTSGLLLALRGDEMSQDGPHQTPESARETDGNVIWMDLRIGAGLRS